MKKEKEHKKKRNVVHKKSLTDFGTCLITDNNIDSLRWLDKRLQALRKKRGDNNTISHYEKLFDLGKKGFNLTSYFFKVAECKFYPSNKYAVEVQKAWKMEVDKRKKRERDYARILKILEKYERPFTKVNGKKVNDEPRFAELRLKLHDFLCAPYYNELKYYHYLNTKNIEPEKNYAANWQRFTKLMKWIAQDLQRLDNYSENMSYETTAELMRGEFPSLFDDLNGRSVRERCKYSPKGRVKKGEIERPPSPKVFTPQEIDISVARRPPHLPLKK